MNLQTSHERVVFLKAGFSEKEIAFFYNILNKIIQTEVKWSDYDEHI